MEKKLNLVILELAEMKNLPNSLSVVLLVSNLDFGRSHNQGLWDLKKVNFRSDKWV